MALTARVTTHDRGFERIRREIRRAVAGQFLLERRQRSLTLARLRLEAFNPIGHLTGQPVYALVGAIASCRGAFESAA
jgi:hypothetical protein